MKIREPKLSNFDPQLQKLLNNFSSLFNIRIAYYLPDGKECSIGENKNMSLYCDLLRKKLNLDSSCKKLDEEKQSLARETRCMQVYTCHGGCLEVIKPIFHGDIFLGYVMMGQIVLEKKIPKHIQRLSELHSIFQDIEQAFAEITYIDNDKINEIVTFFSEITDLIVLKNLVKDVEFSPIQRVLLYMQHTNHMITLAEASKIANLSESHFRHRFVAECGKTYSYMKTKIALEKAHKLLLNSHHLTIREVAYEVGFLDESYFSKVYKKFYGLSPKGMKNLHTNNLLNSPRQ